MEPFYPTFDHLYVDGYRSALQDVLEVIDYIQDDLKTHKRKQNAKTYKAIVECMMENRTVLRENPKAFIRCKSDGGYELWYDQRKR